MAPASVQIVCMEPIIFLRGQSAVGEDARGRRRPINFDAPPSQLRGLLTMTLPRPSRIKEVSITLHGRARTDWPEGIGPNRLDTVEESTIFKQKIVLYDAKDVPQADVRGRPRSSSVGPGTTGNVDDADWAALTQQMNGATVTPPSGLNTRNGHSSRPTSSRSSQDRGPGEERKNSTIAKAIGKTAAKAGSAILPPTLIRELQASRQNGQSHPPHMTYTRSPEVSPLSSPAVQRPSPLQMQRGQSEQRPRQDYFEPPPVYNRANDDAIARPRSAPTAEAAFVASADAGASQSSDSALPVGSSGLHPQSVSAAGPSSRSILHTERRSLVENGTRARETPSGASSPSVVRFDPSSIAPLVQTTSPISASPNGVPQGQASTPPRMLSGSPGVASAQSSPGITRSPSLLLPNNKGKGRMQTTPSASSSSTKRGLKGILGTLLKEDDERQKNDSRTQHDEDDTHLDWREFKKGTYTYPFSIPLPSNLPPTLHADFGSNAYVIRAHVHRAGPLTSNLSAEKEVTLVHAPDEDGQDDMESIIVERNWEDALRYMVVVMGKSFPVGGKIPIWAKFVPTDKVRIHRIIASLEERTAYYAKARRVARHEVPRRWTLLKLLPSNPDEGILPIISEAPNAIESSCVTKHAIYAQELYSSDAENAASEAVAALTDSTGPWELAMDLEVPKAAKTRINISSNHNKSNIAVHHIVKIAIRVERLDGMDEKASRNWKAPEGQRKLYDILIDAPVAINHSQTANIWLSLPDYWSVAEDGGVPTGADAFSNMPGNSTIASRPSASTHESDAIPARNSQLVQLGRTWLSLSGAAPQDVGTSSGQPSSGSSDVLPPFAPSSRATVTYSESSVHGGADDFGLPSYAMIDNERGSVDPPPSQRALAAK